ncbi:MAG: hypothetical protein ABS81_14305 [Pseudonocardia sp. SCN 72-86]|nr:MAG: hypothetical protein ABS81_14305 [Pseudonocardia sp. SCN 72-86]
MPAGADLRLGRAVTGPDAGVATLDGHEPPTFGSCVLATGAAPRTLPVAGTDHPGVALLRTLGAARTLRERAAKTGSAVVVGSGFIGCEAAASPAPGEGAGDRRRPGTGAAGGQAREGGRRVDRWVAARPRHRVGRRDHRHG